MENGKNKSKKGVTYKYYPNGKLLSFTDNKTGFFMIFEYDDNGKLTHMENNEGVLFKK